MKTNKYYKMTIEEILNDKNLISAFKYKRLYEQTKKELEDYKGSRLKYKRLASYYEFKYNQLINSKTFKIINFIKNKSKSFYPIKKKRNKNNKNGLNNKQINVTSRNALDSKDSNEFRNKVFNIFKDKIDLNSPYTLIYADLNMNVVDGSSIWLSSVVNLFTNNNSVIILSKYNLKNKLIISNIKNLSKTTIVQPSQLDLKNELDLKQVSEILTYIDEVVPNIQNVIVRGIEAINEIIKTNNFKYRLLPYLTNFYIQKENNYIEIKKEAIDTIKLLNLQTKYWLWQTDKMKKFVEESINIKFDRSIIFPPIIEKVEKNRKIKHKNRKNEIVIGYAGKIQPDWGVLELIEEVDKLRRIGYNVKLKIISSKISWRSTIKSGKGFVNKVKENLNKEFIEYRENLNREEAIEELLDVDYIWSWRDATFENTTLELSTKLLEGASLGKPVINFPSDIHRAVLGKDYPFYLENITDLKKILNKDIDANLLENLQKNILNKYSYESRNKDLYKLFTKMSNKTILLNGHDFKFIDHFYSYLKNQGYLIYKDYWEWGEADSIERSKYLLNKSDIIFCEWGLANAVWYSLNKLNSQSLFIRTHLQEINQKAKKFGYKININNINKNIFVSKNVRKKAIDMFKWPKSKTVVIPNYVLNDDYKADNIKKQLNMSFGIVGITPQRKRLDRAISLMEKVLDKYPHAKLYIKGKRPEEYEWMHAPGRVKELDYYYEQYKRINSNPLLKKAIIFDGFANDMPLWYQKIDFILSTSDFESFHYALADGVSSGCLPIVWNWDEASEIYNEAWIVNNIDEALLKIQNYLKLSYSELNNLRIKNRDLIIKKYGYKKIFKDLINLLELKDIH